MSEKQQIAVELSEDVFEALKQRAEETGQPPIGDGEPPEDA